MTDDQKDDMLNDLLADLGHKEPRPSDRLIQKVLSQAYDMQPEAPAARSAEPAPRLSLLTLLGGWGGLGGLTVAASVGLVVGLSPPEFLETQLDQVLGSAALSEFEPSTTVTAFGWDLEEG